MWADTLMSLERGHLQRLAAWALSCVLGGTLLLTWLTVRRTAAPMLRHFAIQTAAWGAVNALIAAGAWRGLALRDYASAQKLVNILWLNTGLDVGYAAVGTTLLMLALRWGPRPGAAGAGVGVMVQGLALALLDLRLILLVGPLQ
jgi:hypothetical protein